MAQENSYSGLIVVVPTRNRAQLAINAIDSVLRQANDEVFVLVSDNSTDAGEAETLGAHCARLNSARVVYVRPPQPLAMCPHWQWALEQALARFDASHVLYLTDRMLFIAGRLMPLLALVKRYPGKVISYDLDRVNDLASPVRAEQVAWTGNVYEVRSSDLLSLTSQMMWLSAMPRMLNNVAPRAVLRAVADRFGDVCNSTAPDMCFAYRCLATVDSILFYERALIVHYALDRSNGESQSRGVMTKDHVDFLANLGSKPLNFAAPIPQIDTVANTILHEYNLVKESTGSPKFPEIDKRRYLERIAQEAQSFENAARRQETLALVDAYRSKWNLKSLEHQIKNPRLQRAITLLRKVFAPKKLWVKFWSMAYIEQPRLFWKLVKALGLSRPALVEAKEFVTVEEALDYASHQARRRGWAKSPLKIFASARIIEKNVV